MTAQHRNRLMVAGVVTVISIFFAAMPVASGAGLGAALVVAAVSIGCAAVVLGVIAYIWSGNDRERAAQGVPPVPPPRR